MQLCVLCLLLSFYETQLLVFVFAAAGLLKRFSENSTARTESK